MKRGLKIAIIVGSVIAVLAIIAAAYFMLTPQSPSSFLSSFSNQDYSIGTNVGDNIGRVTTTNAFNKLNPFSA